MVAASKPTFPAILDLFYSYNMSNELQKNMRKFIRKDYDMKEEVKMLIKNLKKINDHISDIQDEKFHESVHPYTIEDTIAFLNEFILNPDNI